ncbi:MAG: Holliday junction branch migration protein RuvA [Myxococcota bacterium]
MIASLKGVVAEKNLTDAIIDVQGVGYRVNLSLLSLAQLPEQGTHAQLRIRTVVREDAFDLYGFLTRAEEELFLLLTSVSHVGPKVAMSVLSGLDTESLVGAIAKGDVARLTKIHGVGKKTAERIVLELKDKVKTLDVEGASKGKALKTAPPVTSDLVSALVNLGYREAQAETAARTATEHVGEDAAFELLFREALKALRSG